MIRRFALTAALTLAPTLAYADDAEPHDDTEVAKPHDVEPTTKLSPDTSAPAEGAPPPKAVPAFTKRSARADGVVESNPAFNTIPETTWRKVDPREHDESRVFNPAHFLLELRFGAYAPRVDEEFGGKATPYADFFGTSPKFYFGLEGDWLPVRIPYVGSVGAAFGWGRVKASAKAQTSAGAAGSNTTLAINPMYVDGVFRLDALNRYAHIPIVPYAKVGLGMGMWQADGPSGTSSVNGVTGQGTTLGLHMAVGGALTLNAFDRRTAMAMHEETGIHQAYLWGEWMLADLDGFGATNVMHVGGAAGVGGLAIEF